MSRRLDIELTSHRDDGTWTWRAAGAKEPKGVAPDAVVPAGASVGDVLRAELELGLDGAEVHSLVAPKAKRAEPDRIEIIGRPVRDDELVVEHRAPRRERSDRGDRGGRGRDGDDRRGPGGDRGRGRGDRPGGGRDGAPRGEGGDREKRGGPRRSFTAPPPVPERPKAKRLRPKRTHRSAAIAALSEEQRPIAEQVLRGGVPAVRAAIDKQNEDAAAAGKEPVEAKGILALAEQLLPAMRVAEWRDRADAAIEDLDELDLRDLRSVVVAADQGARDDETRAQAEALRVGLTRRVEEEQVLWIDELTQLVAIGRVARALRVASRPPKAGSRLPEPLGTQLADAAGAAMTAETGQERYATMIDAVATSPVCGRVVPAGVPAEPTPELRKAAKRAAKRAPGIAKAFGFTPAPPPSAPTTSAPAGGPKRVPPPPRAPGQIPPPPPRPTAAPSVDVVATPVAAEPEPAAEVSQEAAPEVAGEPTAETAAAAVDESVVDESVVDASVDPPSGTRTEF